MHRNGLPIQKIEIETPYTIGKMGTSGLRQTQEVYNQPLFLEQFCQGIAEFFKELTDTDTAVKNNKTLLIGGDPRMGNMERIKKMAGILIAAGFKVIIADNGLASTPAMSHGIRFLKTAGGIILTASHNPFTDVGIKINMADGSPALEETTDRIHLLQNQVKQITYVDYSEAEQKGLVEYVNIINLYADLLDSIFNFSDMKEKIIQKKIRGAFDPMHGAAGPFAREVFIKRLGLDAVMIRSDPREDLGGLDTNGDPLHPEPDFDFIQELIRMNKNESFNITAAWDSDVDRRLDGGSGFFIESADEFCLFAHYSGLIGIESLFMDTIYFCRSTVTAGSIDLMQKSLEKKFNGRQVKTIETPTGFKWIAELGNWGVEESNGVGNPYIREKDGIFATVFLLKILLHTGKTVQELMEEVWKEHGRVYFTRGEVSGSDNNEQKQLVEIFNNAPLCAGKKFGGLILDSAYSWDYTHPRTGVCASKNAAWVLNFSDGNTVKARFSGTGSGGYTLRVYCSKYDRRYSIKKSIITQPMKDAFNDFLLHNGFPGVSKKYTDEHQPDVYV